ncbi:hypothetical protein ACFLRC_03140 [Candidatus Altiarchaeota archaeon]
MRFGRKGQGAMEYLMTYGWAILVVMIVGIVMWQLGIFNMGSTAVTASGFSRLKPQLAAVALTQTGSSTLVFTNGAGTTISAGTCKVMTDLSATGSAFDLSAEPQTNIGAGDNLVYKIELPGASTAGQGDPVGVDVDIDYSLTVGGITTEHTEHGTIRGPLE